MGTCSSDVSVISCDMFRFLLLRLEEYIDIITQMVSEPLTYRTNRNIFKTQLKLVEDYHDNPAAYLLK